MTTIEATGGPSKLPSPLLSARARLATALSVVALVSVAWMSAENASRDAVQATGMALASNVIRVTLPPVEITARREPASVVSLATSRPLRAAHPAL
jgi:hypothetical protein